jgi:uncharacterized protein
VICLFDTSAIVKLVIDEPGTDESIDVWNRSSTRVASRLAHPELSAALWGAVRAGRLRRGQMPTIEARVTEILGQLVWIELGSVLARAAASLAREQALSGADAVHLAAATMTGPGTVLATFDTRLRLAASAVGFVVAPAQIS